MPNESALKSDGERSAPSSSPSQSQASGICTPSTASGATQTVTPSDQAALADEKKLTSEKTQLEIDVLKLKLRGREPVSWWQRLNYGTVTAVAVVTVVGVAVSLCTYQNSIEVERNRQFQAAISRFESGWPSAASELVARGPEGVRALIYDIDATGNRGSNSWPAAALVALDELRNRHAPLTRDEIEWLTRQMRENDIKIREVLAVQSTSLPQETKDRNDELLRSLTCVQLKLQRLIGTRLDGWTDANDAVARAVRLRLQEQPDC